MTPRLSPTGGVTILARMLRVMPALVLGIGLAAAGCAHEYAYMPVGAGGPAARYPIPPEAPRGEIYVTSFGFMQMDVADGRSAEMMHARLVAVNNGPAAWTIDGRAQQLVVAPAQPPLGPAYINTNTDAGAGPVYVVPPGQHQVFDLYYAVPPPLDHPQQLGGFALDWRVDVAGRPFADRTPFQRFEGSPGGYEPYPDYVYVGLGWGPGWWYGPGFPVGYRPIVRTYYYPPSRARAYGTWRGTPRTAAPGGRWRGSPPSGGAPAPRSGGGWRGSPR
jgi:hypothetical protein